MVEFDGDYFLVKVHGVQRANIQIIANNSKRSSMYSAKEGMWYIAATKANARALDELGLDFAPSAMHFLDSKKKEDSYNSYVTPVFDYSILAKDLYPFQKEGVEWLHSPGNKLLSDSMGLGKTIQVAALFRYAPELLPALVVCPASLKLNWQREIEALSGVKAQVIYGRTPYEIKGLLEKYPVVITNYDILGIEDKEAKKIEEERIAELKAANKPYRKKEVEVNGWCDVFSELPFNSIIADEVQFIAEPSNIRTRALSKICKNRSSAKRIFLSGTPYENRTSQFFTCLNLIAPIVFPNRWRFLMNFCDPKKDRWGWKFDGLTNGKQLHNLVKPLMLRRLKEDVLTQLPPKQKFVVPMELNQNYLKDYRAAEDTFTRGLETGVHKSFSEMKVEAYKAKRDAVIQWIKDYLNTATNKKLVVFFWHKKVLDDLKNEFDYCSVSLSGSTPQTQRQKVVDQFQTDPKVFLFLGQLEASGVGITLTAAAATCFVEFGESAGQHAQGEDRVHRITQKADSVFAYYLIAPDTIEEDIMDTLTTRNKNQKTVLDGKEDEAFFGETIEDFKSGILAAYKRRKCL